MAIGLSLAGRQLGDFRTDAISFIGGIPGMTTAKATSLVGNFETYVRAQVTAGAKRAAPEIEQRVKKLVVVPLAVAIGLGALGTTLGAIAVFRRRR